MKKLCTVALAAALLSSCGGGNATGVKGDSLKAPAVELKNRDDSLSYAVSMLVAGDVGRMLQRMDVDPKNIGDFIRGMREAFPMEDTPEAHAYLCGLIAAAEAADMAKQADAAIYPGEKGKKTNRALFLEGMVAMIEGKAAAMPAELAEEYYNSQIFRLPSEKFMKDNAVRNRVVTLPSGLQYKIEKEGTGPVAKAGDSVSCIYKGTFPNGAVFASTKGKAVDLVPEQQIPGLKEALETLKEGTVCMVYIPWNLAYGDKGSGRMPPYSALVYELEIVKVK